MKQARYLLDTHALVFWNNQTGVLPAFIQFFDQQNQQGMLYVSAISFWEIALIGAEKSPGDPRCTDMAS